MRALGFPAESSARIRQFSKFLKSEADPLDVLDQVVERLGGAVADSCQVELHSFANHVEIVSQLLDPATSKWATSD
jgi:hypothetical protein